MTATDPALTAPAQGWCALSLLHGRTESHVREALDEAAGNPELAPFVRVVEDLGVPA